MLKKKEKNPFKSTRHLFLYCIGIDTKPHISVSEVKKWICASLVLAYKCNIHILFLSSPWVNDLLFPFRWWDEFSWAGLPAWCGSACFSRPSSWTVYQDPHGSVGTFHKLKPAQRFLFISKEPSGALVFVPSSRCIFSFWWMSGCGRCE